MLEPEINKHYQYYLYPSPIQLEVGKLVSVYVQYLTWLPGVVAVAQGHLGVTVVEHSLVVVVHRLVNNLQAVVPVVQKAGWWTDHAPRPGPHERRRGGLLSCW